MLVEIKYADPNNSGEVSITSNSPSDEYIFTPIARSYNQKPWEQVQGPLMNSFNVNRCSKTDCTMRLKKAGQFFLMSFKHDLPTWNAKLARFFMQTTFGPTTTMLSNWNYSSNNKGLAQWVRNQIRDVPATKHREFFRSHADSISYNNTIGDRNIAVQHPCEKNSRWKKHAFSFYDTNQYFEVVADGNKFAILIDGVVRTVVDSFRSDDYEYTGIGSYKFCKLLYRVSNCRY